MDGWAVVGPVGPGPKALGLVRLVRCSFFRFLLSGERKGKNIGNSGGGGKVCQVRGFERWQFFFFFIVFDFFGPRILQYIFSVGIFVKYTTFG